MTKQQIVERDAFTGRMLMSMVEDLAALRKGKRKAAARIAAYVETLAEQHGMMVPVDKASARVDIRN